MTIESSFPLKEVCPYFLFADERHLLYVSPPPFSDRAPLRKRDAGESDLFPLEDLLPVRLFDRWSFSRKRARKKRPPPIGALL